MQVELYDKINKKAWARIDDLTSSGIVSISSSIARQQAEVIDCNNVIPFNGDIRKIGGFSSITATIDPVTVAASNFKIIKLIPYISHNGTDIYTALVIMTNNRIFKMINSVVSDLAGTVMLWSGMTEGDSYLNHAVDADIFFEPSTVKTYIVYNAYTPGRHSNKIYYDGTTWNQSALISSTTDAKYVRVFGSHIICANISEASYTYPHKIMWSDFNSTAFTGGTSGSAILRKSQDTMTGIEILDAVRLLIFKENSISICNYRPTGLAPFTFDENAINDVGCISAGSIAKHNNQVIFLSIDNVYKIDSSGIYPIGYQVIDDILDNLSLATVHNINSMIVDNLYLLNIGGKNYIYDMIRNTWWKGGITINACGYDVLIPAGISANDVTLSSVKSYKYDGIIVASGNNVYRYDLDTHNLGTSVIESHIDFGDYNLGFPEFYKSVYAIGLEYKGSGLSVDYSTDLGVTWNNLGSIPDTNSWDKYAIQHISFSCEFVRLRFKTSSANSWFNIKSFTVYFQQGEAIV